MSDKSKVYSPADMAFAEYIGRNVRKKRIELSFTQADVVDRCDISKTFLSDIENGKRNIGLRKMLGLAKALDCSITWFTAGWKEPTG